MKDLQLVLTIALSISSPPSFADPRNDNADEVQEGPIYMDQLYSLPEYGKTTLFIDFSHVLQHDEILARAISEQYYRYVRSFSPLQLQMCS